jgi:DNA-directed RNA polymerase specialized sigma24 family protein
MTLSLGRSALGQQSFEKLLSSLDPDRDRAGEKYESIRTRLVRIFEWRGCCCADSLADETIDRVGRRLEQAESIFANDLAVYAYGVARNVLREYWAEKRRETTAWQKSAPPRETSEKDLPEQELEERLQCLDQCLAVLPRESLELILLYYGGEKGERIARRADLARNLAITLPALRIRAHRIRRQLQSGVTAAMKTRAES